MDPTELLADLLANLRNLSNDPKDDDLRDEVLVQLEDLQDWLDGGGFAPEVANAFNKAKRRW